MLEAGKILGLGEIRAGLSSQVPILMLDRVEIQSDKQAWAIKNLSGNEAFFMGHFPNHPIVPGVLQIESMKQLAEILLRDELDPSGQRDIYMRRLEKAKFRNPNIPGDRMKIEVEVISVADGEAKLNATTANASGLTCEATITLAVRERSTPTAMPKLFNEFDRAADTLMDSNKIMAVNPHRFPFLLLDAVVSNDGKIACAVKNVTGNEYTFARAGASDYAVMPETLLCEIVAQAGCACVLSRPEAAGKLGYFAAIMSAESLAPVYPGDQLVVEFKLPPTNKAFGKGDGVIRVEGREVFRISLMFAIVDPS